jgi:hypothetical protein
MPKLISIPELLHEYETRLLKDKLLEFPSKLQYKKHELFQARQLLTEAQVARNEEESLLKVMISAETNPDTGKPAFTNAEARAAELINRKKMSTEYQQAEKVCSSAEASVNSLQFDLEQLQDEFRAYRYVVDLTARELALMASDNLAGEKENGSGGNGGNGDSRQRQPY